MSRAGRHGLRSSRDDRHHESGPVNRGMGREVGPATHTLMGRLLVSCQTMFTYFALNSGEANRLAYTSMTR